MSEKIPVVVYLTGFFSQMDQMDNRVLRIHTNHALLLMQMIKVRCVLYSVGVSQNVH